jgi:hypothetical protein
MSAISVLRIRSCASMSISPPPGAAKRVVPPMSGK